MKRLCLGKEVSLEVTKRNIEMNDFTIELQICRTIIFGHLSPCTHMTEVPNMYHRMVSCILDRIHLNFDRLVI